MSGEERREQIKSRLEKSDKPLSAAFLAGEYNVSRQVIVQDIALLRAVGCGVISTHRGYVLKKADSEGNCFRQIFKVQHTDEETLDELYGIVDLGGKVIDVYINHRAYGRVKGELNINSRKKADELVEKIRSGKSSHLKNITSGYHYHTVEADSRETLEEIKNVLREKKYLIENMEQWEM